MADEPGSYDASIFFDIESAGLPAGLSGALDVLNVGSTTSTTYYVMRGLDVDCGSPTYRIWIVTDAPDTTGASYSGTKCGASSLSDIVVLKKFVS